jgi:hypothetical protein
MNRQIRLSRIGELLVRFSGEVKILNAASLYDVNIHAENILIPLLNEVHDVKLVNANFEEEKNFSAVDLIDRENRIAIQVTSSSDNEKVKHTLSQFVKYKRYEDFDILFIYIISDKQSSYSGAGHKAIIADKFHFDKDKHIIDNTDLFKMISGFTSLVKIQAVLDLLEAEFTDAKIEERKKKLENPPVELANDKIFPNLLEVKIPEYVYIAKLDIDREAIIKRSWEGEYKLKMRSSDKNVLRQAMKENNDLYFRDFYISAGQLISFKDLGDSSQALGNYIDKGTVERIKSEDYWGQNDDALRSFVGLLNGTFEELLMPKAIRFIAKEGIYRFGSDTRIMKSRIVAWKNKNAAKRTVIFEMLDKEKQLITCYRHYAFRARFQQFGDGWFLSINPTWSFTSDGYNKSGFSKNNLAGIKRMENNNTIFYAFLFTAFCLRNSINSETEYPYMQFEPPVFDEVASEYGRPEDDLEENLDDTLLDS